MPGRSRSRSRKRKVDQTWKEDEQFPVDQIFDRRPGKKPGDDTEFFTSWICYNERTWNPRKNFEADEDAKGLVREFEQYLDDPDNHPMPEYLRQYQEDKAAGKSVDWVEDEVVEERKNLFIAREKAREAARQAAIANGAADQPSTSAASDPRRQGTGRSREEDGEDDPANDGPSTSAACLPRRADALLEADSDDDDDKPLSYWKRPAARAPRVVRQDSTGADVLNSLEDAPIDDSPTTPAASAPTRGSVLVTNGAGAHEDSMDQSNIDTQPTSSAASGLRRESRREKTFAGVRNGHGDESSTSSAGVTKRGFIDAPTTSKTTAAKRGAVSAKSSIVAKRARTNSGASGKADGDDPEQTPPAGVEDVSTNMRAAGPPSSIMAKRARTNSTASENEEKEVNAGNQEEETTDQVPPASPAAGTPRIRSANSPTAPVKIDERSRDNGLSGEEGMAGEGEDEDGDPAPLEQVPTASSAASDVRIHDSSSTVNGTPYEAHEEEADGNVTGGIHPKPTEKAAPTSSAAAPTLRAVASSSAAVPSTPRRVHGEDDGEVERDSSPTEFVTPTSSAVAPTMSASTPAASVQKGTKMGEEVGEEEAENEGVEEEAESREQVRPAIPANDAPTMGAATTPAAPATDEEKGDREDDAVEEDPVPMEQVPPVSSASDAPTMGAAANPAAPAADGEEDEEETEDDGEVERDPSPMEQDAPTNSEASYLGAVTISASAQKRTSTAEEEGEEETENDGNEEDPEPTEQAAPSSSAVAPTMSTPTPAATVQKVTKMGEEVGEEEAENDAVEEDPVPMQQVPPEIPANDAPSMGAATTPAAPAADEEEEEEETEDDAVEEDTAPMEQVPLMSPSALEVGAEEIIDDGVEEDPMEPASPAQVSPIMGAATSPAEGDGEEEEVEHEDDRDEEKNEAPMEQVPPASSANVAPAKGAPNSPSDTVPKGTSMVEGDDEEETDDNGLEEDPAPMEQVPPAGVRALASSSATAQKRARIDYDKEENNDDGVDSDAAPSTSTGRLRKTASRDGTAPPKLPVDERRDSGEVPEQREHEAPAPASSSGAVAAADAGDDNEVPEQRERDARSYSPAEAANEEIAAEEDEEENRIEDDIELSYQDEEAVDEEEENPGNVLAEQSDKQRDDAKTPEMRNGKMVYPVEEAEESDVPPSSPGAGERTEAAIRVAQNTASGTHERIIFNGIEINRQQAGRQPCGSTPPSASASAHTKAVEKIEDAIEAPSTSSGPSSGRATAIAEQKTGISRKMIPVSSNNDESPVLKRSRLEEGAREKIEDKAGAVRAGNEADATSGFKTNGVSTSKNTPPSCSIPNLARVALPITAKSKAVPKKREVSSTSAVLPSGPTSSSTSEAEILMGFSKEAIVFKVPALPTRVKKPVESKAPLPATPTTSSTSPSGTSPRASAPSASRASTSLDELPATPTTSSPPSGPSTSTSIPSTSRASTSHDDAPGSSRSADQQEPAPSSSDKDPSFLLPYPAVDENGILQPIEDCPFAPFDWAGHIAKFGGTPAPVEAFWRRRTGRLFVNRLEGKENKLLKAPDVDYVSSHELKRRCTVGKVLETYGPWVKVQTLDTDVGLSQWYMSDDAVLQQFKSLDEDEECQPSTKCRSMQGINGLRRVVNTTLHKGQEMRLDGSYFTERVRWINKPKKFLFEVGQKLETYHNRQGEGIFNPATVKEVDKPAKRIVIHYDGYPAHRTESLNFDDYRLFPCGFAASIGWKCDVPPTLKKDGRSTRKRNSTAGASVTQDSQSNQAAQGNELNPSSTNAPSPPGTSAASDAKKNKKNPKDETETGEKKRAGRPSAASNPIASEESSSQSSTTPIRPSRPSTSSSAAPTRPVDSSSPVRPLQQGTPGSAIDDSDRSSGSVPPSPSSTRRIIPINHAYCWVESVNSDETDLADSLQDALSGSSDVSAPKPSTSSVQPTEHPATSPGAASTRPPRDRPADYSRSKPSSYAIRPANPSDLPSTSGTARSTPGRPSLNLPINRPIVSIESEKCHPNGHHIAYLGECDHIPPCCQCKSKHPPSNARPTPNDLAVQIPTTRGDPIAVRPRAPVYQHTAMLRLAPTPQQLRAQEGSRPSTSTYRPNGRPARSVPSRPPFGTPSVSVRRAPQPPHQQNYPQSSSVHDQPPHLDPEVPVGLVLKNALDHQRGLRYSLLSTASSSAAAQPRDQDGRPASSMPTQTQFLPPAAPLRHSPQPLSRPFGPTTSRFSTGPSSSLDRGAYLGACVRLDDEREGRPAGSGPILTTPPALSATAPQTPRQVDSRLSRPVSSLLPTTPSSSSSSQSGASSSGLASSRPIKTKAIRSLKTDENKEILRLSCLAVHQAHHQNGMGSPKDDRNGMRSEMRTPQDGAESSTSAQSNGQPSQANPTQREIKEEPLEE